MSLNSCFSPKKMPDIPRVTEKENAKVFTTDFTAPDDYLIVPGDSLLINIYRRSDLSPLFKLVDYTVDTIGRISIPIIGDIQAKGMTIGQLRSRISHDLSDLFVSPVVNVILKKATGRKIFVLGEVKKPGAYSIDINTTAIESILMSGGFTKDADTAKVVILRTVPAKSGTSQNKHLTTLDIEKLLAEADIRQNVILRKGDIVFVPPDHISESNRYYKYLANKFLPFTNLVGSAATIAILMFSVSAGNQ